MTTTSARSSMKTVTSHYITFLYIPAHLSVNKSNTSCNNSRG